MRVLNLTGQTLNVFWNDFKCVETFIQTLEPGAIFFQETGDGHEWIFRDQAGALAEQFTASTSQPIVSLGGGAYNPVSVNSACSGNGTSDEMVLNVINNTADPVLLNWINYECAEDPYQIVLGNAQTTQNTFVGHDWVVRFADGRLAEQATVTAGIDNTIIINPPTVQATPPPPPTASLPTVAPTVVPSTTTASSPPSASGCAVRAVTPDMRLESFYTKYCDYNGILILGSNNVSDTALQQAWLITASMLYNRSDLVDQMVFGGTMITIISEEETPNQVPEMGWEEADQSMNRVWFKATEAPRVTVIGEELLLCTREPQSIRENLAYGLAIQVRNTTADGGFNPTLPSQLEALHATAVASGTWDSNQSMTFFWNQGVMNYFGIAGTRAELQQTYPELYSLIDQTFNGAVEFSVPCPGATTGAAAPAAGSGVTCVIQAQGANLRSAPTADANSFGSLSGSATGVAQTNGADGFVWYRLSNNSWIRSDVTFAEAACANLPFE